MTPQEVVFYSKFLLEVVMTVIVPLLFAYTGYVHRRISELGTRFEEVRVAYYTMQSTINKDFATREDLGALETKITMSLNRIDDKLTKLAGDR